MFLTVLVKKKSNKKTLNPSRVLCIMEERLPHQVRALLFPFTEYAVLVCV